MGATEGLEGVTIWEDPHTGRRLMQVHYSALGPEVVERIQKKAQSYTGGVNDPVFQADYELNLKAQPGDMIFKSFGEHNIRPVEPDRTLPQVLSFDFGYSPDATAILAAQVTASEVEIYYEHYLKEATAKVHKARLRMGLTQMKAFEEFCSGEGLKLNIFDGFLAVGDVAGGGFIAEYGDEPWPIYIQAPSSEPGWRDREGSEAILDGLLRPLKRCCNRVWPDEDTHCGGCKKEIAPKPGISIDPRCRHLIEEIPAQVIDENGKRNRHVPDDAVDSCLYLVRYAMRLGVEKAREPKSRPWWLPKPQPKGIDDEDRAAYGDNEAIVRFFQ